LRETPYRWTVVSMTASIPRFFCRPSGMALSATGREEP